MYNALYILSTMYTDTTWRKRREIARYTVYTLSSGLQYHEYILWKWRNILWIRNLTQSLTLLIWSKWCSKNLPIRRATD